MQYQMIALARIEKDVRFENNMVVLKNEWHKKMKKTQNFGM